MSIPCRISPLTKPGCPDSVLCGIRRNFFRLSPGRGQVPYVLLTRAPVAVRCIATPTLPLDLHVLSLSLAFILSQDQTLRCCLSCYFSFQISNKARIVIFAFCRAALIRGPFAASWRLRYLNGIDSSFFFNALPASRQTGRLRC